MIWQDILLAIGGFGFSLALLPSVIHKTKIPLTTPLVTAIILTSYLVAYSTLGLWLAFTSGLLTAGLWWYLVWVAIRRGNVKQI